MYQGIPVISLRLIDWKAWIGLILDGLVRPKMYLLHNHTGQIKAL
jgi:hypothetical protein